MFSLEMNAGMLAWVYSVHDHATKDMLVVIHSADVHGERGMGKRTRPGVDSWSARHVFNTPWGPRVLVVWF